MLDLLTGALGLAVFAAAAAVALGLEVVDERTSGGASTTSRRWRLLGRALLVVLVLVALAATATRLIVLGD